MRRAEMTKDVEMRDCSKMTVGIVVADFHADITHSLLDGALELLKEWKVKDKNIIVRHVYGAFDLPFAAQKMLKQNKKMGAVIALGCVLTGETKHNEYISHAVAGGLMRVQLDTRVPIALGVLTPNTLEQAKARSAKGKENTGRTSAIAALSMAMN